MLKKRKLDKRLKLVIQGLPLAAAVGSSFLPVFRGGQQFLMLITLVWIQVFFIVDVLLANK